MRTATTDTASGGRAGGRAARGGAAGGQRTQGCLKTRDSRVSGARPPPREWNDRHFMNRVPSLIDPRRSSRSAARFRPRAEVTFRENMAARRKCSLAAGTRPARLRPARRYLKIFESGSKDQRVRKNTRTPRPRRGATVSRGPAASSGGVRRAAMAGTTSSLSRFLPRPGRT